MEKIPTLFDRDWDGDRKVVPSWSPDAALVLAEPVPGSVFWEELHATEKVDGTNVRLTVRGQTLVRVEARLNPSKQQKADGIVDPWYRDAWPIPEPNYNDRVAPGDRHIVDAARATDLAAVSDGEWAGEAIGEKIQGNSLNLNARRVVLFSYGRAPVLWDCPPLRFEGPEETFERLKLWLPRRTSELNLDRPIEGVVWHGPRGPILKLKTKDFRR